MIENCSFCINYARSYYLVRAIHSSGRNKTPCSDFKTSLQKELWQPEGAAYYDGELIYQPPELSYEERLERLEWHPQFTGRCPNCEMPITQTEPARIHWDCEHCGWKNDSL
ncbi:hypothetical protein Syn6312_1700 [Synechococcus sp. PCC 6312]|nr:hypothetical protein Syn6312_1700 [Synechococcus sp. PCC 6312]